MIHVNLEFQDLHQVDHQGVSPSTWSSRWMPDSRCIGSSTSGEFPMWPGWDVRWWRLSMMGGCWNFPTHPTEFLWILEGSWEFLFKIKVPFQHQSLARGVLVNSRLWSPNPGSLDGAFETRGLWWYPHLVGRSRSSPLGSLGPDGLMMFRMRQFFFWGVGGEDKIPLNIKMFHVDYQEVQWSLPVHGIRTHDNHHASTWPMAVWQCTRRRQTQNLSGSSRLWNSRIMLYYPCRWSLKCLGGFCLFVSICFR